MQGRRRGDRDARRPPRRVDRDDDRRNRGRDERRELVLRVDRRIGPLGPHAVIVLIADTRLVGRRGPKPAQPKLRGGDAGVRHHAAVGDRVREIARREIDLPLARDMRVARVRVIER